VAVWNEIKDLKGGDISKYWKHFNVWFSMVGIKKAWELVKKMYYYLYKSVCIYQPVCRGPLVGRKYFFIWPPILSQFSFLLRLKTRIAEYIKNWTIIKSSQKQTHKFGLSQLKARERPKTAHKLYIGPSKYLSLVGRSVSKVENHCSKLNLWS
jgi:hypothetical protein